MKNVQRINESQLRAIVAESIKSVLKEGMMGSAARRAYNSGKYDDNEPFSLKGASEYIMGNDGANAEDYKYFKEIIVNKRKN